MNRVLILFAHPAPHKSRINLAMVRAVESLDGVTVNDLYENYPDFYIQTKREQDLLTEHDIIVWHHPLYWYSCPALLKEWMDLVLEHDFAYGPNGQVLTGKKALNVITTGGREDVYSEPGRIRYTIREFLAPFHQTALVCGMLYLPPYVVHGAHMLSETDIRHECEKYQKAILALRDGVHSKALMKTGKYFNEIT